MSRIGSAPTVRRGIRFAQSMAVAAVVATAASCTPGPTGPPAPPLPPDNPLSVGVNGVLGDAAASQASLSADGAKVAFSSLATNLVPTPPSDPNTPRVFVRTLATGAVQVIDYGFEPRMSADGQQVSYLTDTTMKVRDLPSGTTYEWPRTDTTGPRPPVVADGYAIYGQVSFFGFSSCVVRELVTGVEESCPFDTGSSAAFTTASSNGRFVGYYNQDGPVIWDRVTDDVTPATGVTIVWGISDDGERVLGAADMGAPFVTPAVSDLGAQTLFPLPVAHTDLIQDLGLSSDGSKAALITNEGLDAADVNGGSDIYVWDVDGAQVDLASRQLESGNAMPGESTLCSFGPGQVLDNGRACIATTEALVAADTNGVTDTYLSNQP